MTVREACNLAYFHIVRDMREEDRAARVAGAQMQDSLQDRIEEFEEKIGLRPAHEDLALWMHKHVMLPAQGYTQEQIDEMFKEESKAALPAGISEADRWRFEDEEYDGLANFEGNPWDLPGLGADKISKDLKRKEKEAKETLG